MQGKFLKDGRFKMHYEIYGEGERPLVCWHGYGLNAGYFKYFKESLLKDFKIYSVDLFLHGYSDVSDDHPITDEEMSCLFMKLLEAEELNKVDVLGYSLGGKVVLKLLEQCPGKINRAILLAPDGIELNKWYNMATNYAWANKLFRYYIVNPAGFFRALNMSRRIGMIGRGMERFVRSEMDRAAKRLRVYKVWMLYKDMITNLKQVSENSEQYNIDVHVVFGKFDKVIPPNLRYQWPVRDGSEVRFHVLGVGHDMFRPEVDRFLKKMA